MTPAPIDRRPKRAPLLLAALLLLASAVHEPWCEAVAASTATAAGDVRFVPIANSAFDQYTRNPSPAQQAWMTSHYWRMLTYAPYFDARLSWFPDAWMYIDLYAIYVGSDVAVQHPEWILRDADGNPLYIPWGCAGGACPQYAGDIGSEEFRDHWIARAADRLAAGYRGMFIDDVNLLFRVGNGAGQQVVPHDPRTGAPMTLADWRRYVAEFTEEIRAAFPDVEIAHNAIWYAGDGDPSVQRAIDAADWMWLERGVNDSGITGGSGTFSFRTFLGHIDFLHDRGKYVVFEGGAQTDAGREYGLAAYFLVSTDADGVGNHPGDSPADWWPGYDVALGAARGDRYLWNGLWRRDFDGGMVLVNEPGAATRSVSLDAAYDRIDGTQVTAVTLGAAQGAVLASAVTPPSPATPTPTTTATPMPTPTSSAPPTPVATSGPPTVTASATQGLPTVVPTPLCAATPQEGCKTPSVANKAQIQLKRKLGDPSKSKLLWSWSSASSTSSGELGDPTAETAYELCVYDAAGLIASATAPAGLCDATNRLACWKGAGHPTGSKGYKYSARDLTPDGIQKIVLQPNPLGGRAKIVIKGKGANLAMPMLPLLPDALPVTVQLKNADGTCWSAVYASDVKRNDAATFKARAD